MTPDRLDGLRDIHLPPLPGMWSDVAGEALGAALLIAAALFLAWRRRRRVRAPVRAALRSLDVAARRFRAGEDDAVALAQAVARILRAEAGRRQPEAAALVGDAWLRHLDRHGGGGAFEHGPGASLADLPYRRAGDVDADALVALAQRWLEGRAP